MISLFRFLLLIFLVQFLDACTAPLESTFTDLEGYNLEGEEVGFEKYENKCVLLLQLSPHGFRPKIQISELNKIYDQYNKQGLEIVAISTHRLDELTEKLKTMGIKFDVYTKEINKDLNQFLWKSKAHLNKFEKILIGRNAQYISKHFFSPYIGFWTTKGALKELKQSIEMCLDGKNTDESNKQEGQRRSDIIIQE